MKRVRLIGVALFAVLGLSAVIAQSAMAAEECVSVASGGAFKDAACTMAEVGGKFELVFVLLAVFLDGGSAVTTELSTQTTGELLLEDTALKAAILCSAIIDGWVGPEGLAFASEVLSLAGVATGTPLTGQSLACVGQAGCASSPAPVVWAVNLGWEIEIHLWEFLSGPAIFVNLITSKNGSSRPGWETECTVLGIKASDECTAKLIVSEIVLEGTTLLEIFSPAMTELATCSFGGGETGLVEGGAAITLNGGGELALSSTE